MQKIVSKIIVKWGLNMVESPVQLRPSIPFFRHRIFWLAVGGLSASALLIAIAILGYLHIRNPLPTHYKYDTSTATNGVELHIIQTDPENVVLKAIDDNVIRTKQYGINGGFFDGEQMLSIAVNDHNPAQGEPNGYGSGWYNVKYPRGTLVWDRSVGRFSIQRVLSADELQVTDTNRYWAQGGISMNLQDDLNWHAAAEEEHMPGLDETHMRSAVLYDDARQLWLVVSPTLCTAEQFRTALKEKGGSSLREGIFLDGDGSSQMRAKGVRLAGDNRVVRQMLALIH
ncbi:hypothetical protein [Gorillibacterium massiliense]|uniref:hypothetical protein n=1 Tax=Gorillibacterium massiliense TaxID=1280390 RepID=UPI0004B0480C|nr:hypothetical protein [Gorillibacterium massiliense]